MNKISSKLNSLLRYAMVYGLSGFIPYYIVTEYPRSGGSWLSNMIADYLEIPFPASKFPHLKKSVIHGHYLYKKSMKNVICLVRDVRDVIVSYYFFSFFYAKEKNISLYNKMKSYMKFQDYESIEDNLPSFIEKLFLLKIYPRFNWQEFIISFYGKKNILWIKYEDLLSNTFDSMYSLLGKLDKNEVDKDKLMKIIEKYTFKRMVKNYQTDDPKSSFLRKGIAGDWKNYFNRTSAEMIDFYAGEGLKLMGYEENRNWIEKFIKEKGK